MPLRQPGGATKWALDMVLELKKVTNGYLARMPVPLVSSRSPTVTSHHMWLLSASLGNPLSFKAQSLRYYAPLGILQPPPLPTPVDHLHGPPSHSQLSHPLGSCLLPSPVALWVWTTGGKLASLCTPPSIFMVASPLQHRPVFT